MKMMKFLLTLLMSAFMLPAAADTSVPLWAGAQRIEAEVASTEAARETGLMGRTALPADHGMLFVFASDRRFCMWMKDTPLPLAVAFIADDGRLVNLAEMQPLTLDTHCSARAVRFALEMPGGWFAAHRIEAGSRLRGTPFAAR